MRRDLLIKSGNLAGTSDFRVLAPIKKGFVPSNEAVTYKTRVKRVLRTTHAGRAGGFEYELARVLSNSVERVGVIHSVGIAVLEPEDKVILTVTFDGAWEAYIRIIWQKATRLLDLVFCNCDGYVLGYESTYEEWGIWLKKAQSEAYFLYATPALTVDDTRYLGMHERVYRREAGDAADLRVTRMQNPERRGHCKAIPFRHRWPDRHRSHQRGIWRSDDQASGGIASIQSRRSQLGRPVQAGGPLPTRYAGRGHPASRGAGASSGIPPDAR